MKQENKINIAELLKDCPQGMELDCTLIEGLEFDCIVDNKYLPIRCRIKNPNGGYNVYAFTKYGCWFDTTYAKCVIFPKGKTTWEGFQRPFKDGDIVISAFGDIHLLRTKDSSYCSYRERWKELPKFDKTITTGIKVDRLATEEEKQELFDTIKANGYKWNPETKTLDELPKPKFKVGDRIKNKNDKWLGTRTIQSYVVGIGYFTTINDWVRIEDQDEWELALDIKPIFKVGDRIKEKQSNIIGEIIDVQKNKYNVRIDDKGLYLYFREQDDWELVPNKFDINTLKPFDKVLVRNKSNEVWTANFYSHYDTTSDKPFICVGWSEMNEYRYCIPYDVNKELLGTTNNS